MGQLPGTFDPSLTRKIPGTFHPGHLRRVPGFRYGVQERHDRRPCCHGSVVPGVRCNLQAGHRGPCE